MEHRPRLRYGYCFALGVLRYGYRFAGGSPIIGVFARGAGTAEAGSAESTPLEPDPDNAGVGKRRIPSDALVRPFDALLSGDEARFAQGAGDDWAREFEREAVVHAV